MENTAKNIILEKFCTDIRNAAILCYNPKFSKFHYQLRRYNQDDDKLRFIKTQKVDILKYLESSPFELVFPQYKDFEANIEKALEKYFKGFNPLRQARGWEFDEGISKGEYGFNIRTRNIFVHPLRPLIGNNPYFNFAELTTFKELPEYIAGNFMLIELNKVEEELNIKLKIHTDKDYTIKESDKLIRQIFEICDSAFDCEYSIFRKGIEIANFHNTNIKRQNIVQDLTYRLSGIMDKEWYTDICKEMCWRKSICSGQGNKLEFDIITMNLDKILPRPTNKKFIQ